MQVNDKDYEEISSTAIVTSYPRTFTDIPYEKEIYNWLKQHCKEEVALYKNMATEIEASRASVGEYVIEGLEEGTYYIEETVAPTGYNAITTDATITIGLTEVDQVTATATVQPKTVTVRNFTGALLPE